MVKEKGQMRRKARDFKEKNEKKTKFHEYQRDLITVK